MSEQDNTLPPGWTAETIREACGNRYSNRHFKDKPSWGFMQDDLFALLRKAYEQGRREVEEAVGAGGVQSLRASAPEVAAPTEPRPYPPMPEGVMVMPSPHPDCSPAWWYDDRDMRAYVDADRAAQAAGAKP